MDDLAALNGEELYHLLVKLDSCESKIVNAGQSKRLSQDGIQALNRWMIELLEIKYDALAQIARITVPFREAQGIIWRAVYARNHPVRVPGT
jgi:hypothetical protein